ncbi:MAG: hypothetical protein N3E41_00640 [Thermofilaceae archaeon]|nr:hypothetical protein [Thermofilaceae archaeon]MDW8004442.1 hypothetical protein [Thermofilaceae archaeon]
MKTSSSSMLQTLAMRKRSYAGSTLATQVRSLPQEFCYRLSVKTEPNGPLRIAILQLVFQPLEKRRTARTSSDKRRMKVKNQKLSYGPRSGKLLFA